MSNLFTTRTNRTTAFAMLLVWTFGLVAGVANACLFEAPGTDIHDKIAQSPAQHAAKHISLAGHLQTAASSAQADDVHTSKQPCLKVCDDSSRCLPKKYPTGQVEPGLPSVIAVLWSLVEPVYLSHKQPGIAQQVVSRVPIRLRYARLAL